MKRTRSEVGRKEGKRTGASCEETQECPVCFDELTKSQMCFPHACGHGLCTTCDQKLVDRDSLRCPVCRTPRHGVSAAEADAAAVANADPPDYASEAYMFFPTPGAFQLENAMLFEPSGAMPFGSVLLPPPSAMGYGAVPWRASSRMPAPGVALRNVLQNAQGPTLAARRGRTNASAQQSRGRTLATRALTIAQTAAAALCDPSLQDADFHSIMRAAIQEETAS